MNKLGVSVCLVVLMGVASSNPFPDSDDMSPSEVYTASLPESCKKLGLSYCFDSEGYPTEIVADLLKDSTLEVSLEEVDEYPFGYSHRQGDHDFECQAKPTKEPIYYIVDTNGKERVVVQMEGRFQQQFTVRQCVNPGEITDGTPHIMKNKIGQHKTYCTNTYVQYDFVVLSLTPDLEGNWKLEKAQAKDGIPVCCKCRYDL